MSAKPNLQPTLQALIDRDRRGLSEHPTPEELADYHAGDLPADEQDALRNHLVLCHDCADLLLDLVSFAEFTPPEQTPSLADGEVKSAWQNLQPRLVAREEPLPAVAQIAERRREGGGGAFVPRRRLMQAYAIAATLLVGVVGLSVWGVSLRRTVGEFRQPQPNSMIVRLAPEGESGTRGGGGPDEQGAISSQKSFILELDPFDSLESTEYAAEILDGSQRVVWQGRGLYKSAEEGVLAIGIPKDYLKPDDYRVHLFRMKGDEKAEMKSFRLSIAPESIR